MDTQVLVAGAGPTGLLLATELERAGVDVIVLDRLATRTGQSKALALQPRSAEVLHLRGLLESLPVPERVPAGHFAGLPVHLDYSALPTRFPYQLGVPQARVEELFEARLTAPVRYGHDVVDVDQDADGVTVRTNHGPLRASYLVGCDGGRSTVRKRLGVDFVGRDPRVSGIVADVTLVDPAGRAPSSWDLPSLVPIDGAVLTLLPLADGVFRLLTAGPEQQGTERDDPVTAGEIGRALDRAYGGSPHLGEIRWATRFSDTTRQAARYRTGRVLLAGDAAHVHSPTGGQGLNVGLQDAFNLGWKLAATVRGTAPAGLLDTYHDERHPVAAAVLANTQAQAILMVPDPDVAALRGVFQDLLRLPGANRHLAGRISGIDDRYQPGRHPLVGSWMPDLDLRVGGAPTTVAGLLRDGHPLLLRFDGGRGGVAATTDGSDLGAVLVRPDGYVAWALDAGDHDDEGLAAATERWFGRP